MNVLPDYRQLEIWWVDLEPTRGAETRKNRPCVILQSDDANRNTRTFIVAPLLPNHKPWLFAVNVMPTAENGLDKLRYINLKQMRSVDISRLSNRQGVLEQRYFPAIAAALGIVLGLDADALAERE